MNRRLTARFREHVTALPAGSRFEWRHIDAWAEANTSKSVRQKYNPDNDDCPWDDLCVDCMGLSEQLEAEGWLAHQVASGSASENGDYYFRTDKPEPQPWD